MSADKDPHPSGHVDKPWLNPPPSNMGSGTPDQPKSPSPSGPWPTEAQVEAAKPKQPKPEPKTTKSQAEKDDPDPSHPSGKGDPDHLVVTINAEQAAKMVSEAIDSLDGDIRDIARAVVEHKAETLVVIGINAKDEVVNLSRFGGEVNPYLVLGALEAFKLQFMDQLKSDQTEPAK